MKLKIHINYELDVTRLLKLLYTQSGIMLLSITNFFWGIRKPILCGFLTLLFVFILSTGRWIWLHKSQPQNKYAVLISAGQTFEDDKFIHSEYWYDLLITYKTLIELGYTHENIYVFYDEGIEYNSQYDHYDFSTYFGAPSIVDYSNHKEDMRKGFEELNYRVTNKDKLLIHWIIGHGSVPYYHLGGYNDYSVLFERWDSVGRLGYARVSKDTIIQLINSIEDYKQREIYWLTCYSGSIIKGDLKFSDFRTTVITSSSWGEYSYSFCPDDPWGYYCNEYLGGEFNWVIYGIFHKWYFNKTKYVPYNERLKYPITPYKIYNELLHSKYMESTVQIGGKSPTAYYIKSTTWVKEKYKDIIIWTKIKARLIKKIRRKLKQRVMGRLELYQTLIQSLFNVERN